MQGLPMTRTCHLMTGQKQQTGDCNSGEVAKSLQTKHMKTERQYMTMNYRAYIAPISHIANNFNEDEK